MDTLTVRLADTESDYTQLGLEPGTIQQFEDGMRTTGTAGDYEWWYFDAHLDNGAKLVVIFHTKPPLSAFGSLAPQIHVALDLPDGRSIKKVTDYSPDDFKASTDSCDVRIGGNSFVGDLHTYRIHVEIDEITVEAELVGQVPAWRAGTGHTYFGEGAQQKLMAWLPCVPQGAVTAAYTVEGRTTRTTGIGYHDHNWGNAPMVEVMHHWYWARGQVGPYTVIAAYSTAEEKYGYSNVPKFMLARDGRIVTDDTSQLVFTAEQVHPDAVTGKPVADVTRYDVRSGESHYSVTFTREQTILQARFLDGLSPQMRAAAESAGFDGAYHRFTGPVSLRHESAGAPVEEHTQNAIWELMYLGRTHPTV